MMGHTFKSPQTTNWFLMFRLFKRNVEKSSIPLCAIRTKRFLIRCLKLGVYTVTSKNSIKFPAAQDREPSWSWSRYQCQLVTQRGLTRDYTGARITLSLPLSFVKIHELAPLDRLKASNQLVHTCALVSCKSTETSQSSDAKTLKSLFYCGSNNLLTFQRILKFQLSSPSQKNWYYHFCLGGYGID